MRVGNGWFWLIVVVACVAYLMCNANGDRVHKFLRKDTQILSIRYIYIYMMLDSYKSQVAFKVVV